MLSLKHGERLSYADFILREIICTPCSPSAINLLYDIGCKLKSNWKCNPQQYADLISVCNIAVPIFHAYAHNAQCQHAYSPRKKVGFGLTDGENMERLWSYLGRFSHSTKEMSSANRVDALSDAIFYYASKKCTRLETSIVERSKRAYTLTTSSKQELQEICNGFGITDERMRQLLLELRQEEDIRLSRITQYPDSITDWRQTYVGLLKELQALQAKWSSILTSGVQIIPPLITKAVEELQRLEAKLQEIELAHNVPTRWTTTSEEFQEVVSITSMLDKQKIKYQLLAVTKERVFYINTLAHHAGGQRQAQRISKLIANCSRKATSLLQRYNNIDPSQQCVLLPEVFDLNSSFWCSDHTYSSIERIPPAQQRRIVELCDILTRSSEEIQLCLADLINLYTSTATTLSSLHQHILNVVDHFPENDAAILEMSLQLHQFISEHTSILPRHKVGELALFLNEAELTFYRLNRVEDVTRELSSAYWSKSMEESNKCMQNAIRISKLPIFPTVRYIDILQDDTIVPSDHNGSTCTSSHSSNDEYSCLSSSSEGSSSQDIDDTTL